tara:strand:+ start:523 stop:972 length:450 start_codon:yes stop_codon:yes gene_type:complete
VNKLLILILLPLSIFSQNLGGRFSYGSSPDSGRTGSLDIYQESDSSIIFCLDLSRGAPSYNTGFKTARIIKEDNQWVFQSVDFNCKLKFIILDDRVEIITLKGFDNCGYGFGVYSDGTYIRYETGNPEYYLQPPDYEKKSFKEYNLKND